MAAALKAKHLTYERTSSLQRAFLTAYRACGAVRQAADMAGINPVTHYRWLADKEYAAAFEGARKYYMRRYEQTVRLQATATEYDLVCPICWAFREIRVRLRYASEEDFWECPTCKAKIVSPDDNLRAMKEDMLGMYNDVVSTMRLHPGGGGSGRKRKKVPNKPTGRPATLA